MSYIQQPQEIEKNSFLIIDDIIRETRPEYRFVSDDHAAIIKRAIHTTADFDWRGRIQRCAGGKFTAVYRRARPQRRQ